MPKRSDEVTEWSTIVDLIERVMSDDDLLPQVMAGVRASVAEVAALPVSDMGGHMRALLTAATRALAARRGPTAAELTFVEDLAITRAAQGISIEVVLGAIHVAERAIWTRARALAEADGVSATALLDARELYDDWAEAVRARLIRAHREAHAEDPRSRGDRRVELVRRLLEGGSAATLAAAEAGLPYGGGLWILVARHGDTRAEGALRQLRGEQKVSLSAPVSDTLVAITAARPVLPDGEDAPVVGYAGPVSAEEAGAGYRLASAAVSTAEAVGRSGAVHVSEVASVVALLSRTDVVEALAARHLDARRELGASAEPVALAVRAWVEADRDTTEAARVLYVHPNTVRNRVQRFTRATGIDPLSTFGAVDAWWLSVAWLGHPG